MDPDTTDARIAEMIQLLREYTDTMLLIDNAPPELIVGFRESARKTEKLLLKIGDKLRELHRQRGLQ